MRGCGWVLGLSTRTASMGSGSRDACLMRVRTVRGVPGTTPCCTPLTKQALLGLSLHVLVRQQPAAHAAVAEHLRDQVATGQPAPSKRCREVCGGVSVWVGGGGARHVC
jgi:hypothetical protein